MPSTGLELLKGAQLARRFRIERRRAGVSGIHFSGVLGKHVVAHVVHDLDSLYPGVDLQDLGYLSVDQRPGKSLHGSGRINDEDDVLAVDRDAADGGVRLGPAITGAEQPSLLLAQGLSGLFELPLYDGLGFQGEALAFAHLARARERRLKFGEASADLLELRLILPEFLRQGPGFLAHGLQFGAALLDQSGKVGADLLDDHGLGDLDDHQEQDDGAEPAGDHVEKRHVEDVDVPSLPGFHGRVLLRLMASPSRG